MDKKNEEVASSTGTNPLYQGTSRPGAGGDEVEKSLNEAEDAVPIRDNDEQSPDEKG